MDIYVVET